MAQSAGKFGVCTFGTRPAVDIDMMIARIIRERQHFEIYKHFTPDFTTNPVTGKFYARHDQIENITPEQREREKELYKGLQLSRNRGPHAKYPRPVTENQCYGWTYTPLCKIDRGDRRFNHPIKESPHTKIMLQIMTDTKHR